MKNEWNRLFSCFIISNSLGIEVTGHVQLKKFLEITFDSKQERLSFDWVQYTYNSL